MPRRDLQKRENGRRPRADFGGGEVRAIQGEIRLRMECRPAFDYARPPHEVEIQPDSLSAIFHTAAQQFALKSAQPLRRDGAGVVASRNSSSSR
jgi:hypothetical protein